MMISDMPLPSQFFSTQADPRPGVFLATFFGLLVWSMSFIALALWGCALLCIFLRYGYMERIPTGSIRRIALVCLFWVGLKWAIDVVFLLLAVPPLSADASWTTQEYGIAFILHEWRYLALAPVCKAGGLLFLRLFLLMFMGLLLTTTFSARKLGLAVGSFLRPVLGKRYWQVALSLALMAQYFPLVFQYLEQLRLAAQLRGVSHTGIRFWKYALPQLCSLLHARSYSSAVGLTARHLDAEEAWNLDICLPYATYLFLFCICMVASIGAYLL